MIDQHEYEDITGERPDWQQQAQEEAHFYCVISEFLDLIDQYGIDNVSEEVLKRVKS